MRIGELARFTGASVKAIRLYEEKGLLPPVPREGSYRRYEQRHLEQVVLIRQAQGLGFRLSELSAVPVLNDGFDWQQLRALLEQKRTSVQQSLMELQRQDLALQSVINELDSCPEVMGRLTQCEPESVRSV